MKRRMNRMGIFGVLFITALSAATPASWAAASVNFTGHWSGSGELISTNGKKSPCSKVQIHIEHDSVSVPQKLVVKLYDARCGYLAPEWGPYLFEIQDGKVFEDGEETGTLEGNLFKSLQASGGAQYAFNLRLVPGTDPSGDVLRSYYGVRNLLGAMVIEGDLKRSH